MPAATLALDFGTSNSAAAFLDGGKPRRLEIEPGADTLATAVFFPTDGGPMRIGNTATAALIDGAEGRYMRALKSVLGTALLHEKRPVGGRRQTLAEIVTAFLVAVKERAEEQAGRRFPRVLSGRPVHFHSADPARDARAESDLRACYHAAGFGIVDFFLEPEAAALASRPIQDRNSTGLIVDIGGGTSDFTVFRTAAERQVEILASHGIRLGGTDFDHAISMRHVMPLLGRGGQLRRTFGSGLLPVPNAIYSDLSTWSKIPFLYAQDTRRAVAEMRRLAVDPAPFDRLATVIEEELGHELAFAVEAGKIAANTRETGAAIELGCIEPGLGAAIDGTSLDGTLAAFRERLGEAMRDTLGLAGVAAGGIGSVTLVGGSSLMGMVAATVHDLCPAADLHRAEAFTAVVDGLALATRN